MADYKCYVLFRLTVIVPGGGSISCDDFHAAVGRVVGPFTLFAVVVTDVVGVLLVKLHRINIAQLRTQLLLIIVLTLYMPTHILCVYEELLSLKKNLKYASDAFS